MKTNIPKLLLVALLSVTIGFSLMGGCATTGTPIPPATNVQVSSYTVQAAEHSLRAAKDTFDLFFDLVHTNHELLVAQKPESPLGQVYAFAERMQVQAPAAMKRANAAKNAFKYNRTADNQANLNTVMATIVRYQTEVKSNTNAIQTATP